jgi:hypothetical protein
MSNNNLKGSCVYLVGSIDDSEDFGTGWRQEITPFLHNLGIGVFDPTNKPSIWISESEDEVNHLNELKKRSKFDALSHIMKKIVSIDLHFLDLSNFVIAHLDFNVRITGSITELTYAALEKKPIIVICPQGKENIPNWLFGLLDHDKFFISLDKATEYIEAVNQLDVRVFPQWRFINYDKVFGSG